MPASRSPGTPAPTGWPASSSRSRRGGRRGVPRRPGLPVERRHVRGAADRAARPARASRTRPSPTRCGDRGGAGAVPELWPRLPEIAVDHAVAEPAAAAGRVAVVPADLGWDDVGDFDSLPPCWAGVGPERARRRRAACAASPLGAGGPRRRSPGRGGGPRRRRGRRHPATRCWSPAGRTPSGSRTWWPASGRTAGRDLA